MHGIHLIADLHKCRCPIDLLQNATTLESFCLNICKEFGLSALGRCFYQFRNSSKKPAGATGTVVLAESHLAIHTWPELFAVTLDIYVCNYSEDNSDRAYGLFAKSIEVFDPENIDRKIVTRGHLGPAKTEIA